MPNIPERQVTNPTDLQFVTRDSGLVVPAGNRGDGNVVQNLVKTTVSPKFELPQGRPAMLGGLVEPIPVAVAAPADRPAEIPANNPENPDIEDLRQQIQRLVEQMQDRGDEIDQLRDQLQQLTDRLQDLTNNINQLTQQNAQIIQQNSNILQQLQQLIANQGGNQQPPAQPPAQQPPAQPPQPPQQPPAQPPQPPQQPPAQPPQPPQQPPAQPPQQPPAQPPQQPPTPNQAPNNPNQQPNLQQLQENLANAETELNEIRGELLEVTIRRKARSGDHWLRRRREDAHDYEDLMTQYQEALDNYLHALGALRKAEYDRAHANNPMSHQEVARLLTREAFEERRRFINQEFELNNQHLDELGWFGKSLRKWANLSTKKKIAIGLVVGAGTAVTSGLLGAGLFGLAAGSAAKFSLGLFNRRASMRNVSEHSRDRMLDRVTRDLRRALGGQILRNNNISDDQALEAFRGHQVDHIHDEFDGYVQSAQRRNRIGNGVLLASGIVGGLGVAGEAGALAFNPSLESIPGMPDVDLPHIPGLPHVPGIGHGHGGPNPNVPPGPSPWGPNAHPLPENFQMNTIYAHDTNDFINNTFGNQGLLERQGIHVQGLTPEKAQHLAEYLQNHHWRTVEGMQADGQGGLEQHVVNAASWQDGINNPSHAEAWTSKEELERAMQIAHDRFQINFTEGS